MVAEAEVRSGSIRVLSVEEVIRVDVLVVGGATRATGVDFDVTFMFVALV